MAPVKLIDANVFIYAAGRDPRYQQVCSRVLTAAVGKQIDANTNVEVFQEILHRFLSLKMADRGIQVMRDAITGFPDAILITPRIMERAAEVLLAHPHLQSRDAVHAAVVLEHRLEGIISADRAFEGIPGITRFDPRDLFAQP